MTSRSKKKVVEVIPPFKVLVDLTPASENDGCLDVFVVPSDTGTPIKLRTRGGSAAWVDLSVAGALDLARELIRLAQERMGGR